MIQYPLGVNGVTTRVLDSATTGEPLILLHGLGARADRFQLNIDALGAAGYRTIAVDLPGHGFAQKGPLPYSIPYYATFLLDLMDELGFDRVSVIGTSMGGHVAAYAATQKPERFSSLIMIGTLGIVAMGLGWRTAISHAIPDQSREAIRVKLAFVLQQSDLLTEEWVDEEYRINNSPGSDEAAGILSAYFLDNTDDDVIGARLAEVTDRIRTLLIWGENDSAVAPSVGHAAQEVLGKTPLVFLRDTGHVPYLERPSVFNTVVVDFLSGNLKESHVQRL